MNVIITGASKGLGKAIAEKFVAANNTLILCARNKEVLSAAKQELQQKNPGCTIEIMAVDISKKENAIAFGNFCLQKGTPDILVNNAGSFLPGSIYEEANDTIRKNDGSEFVQRLLSNKNIITRNDAGKKGHIFNMCSVASIKAYTNGGSYSISKFALLGLTKNLREELMPFNIKVTAILPGAAYTDSWKSSGIQEDRLMQADDVAKMIYAASLLSPQACVEEILLRPQLGDI